MTKTDISDQIKQGFFQTVAMSLLLYGVQLAGTIKYATASLQRFKTLSNKCPRYDTNSPGDLRKVGYPLIAITPRSTLTWNDSPCLAPTIVQIEIFNSFQFLKLCTNK